MTNEEALAGLKGIKFYESHISLVIVKEYKKGSASHYNVKYVQINPSLENRLRAIISAKVNTLNTVEEYSFDCPEPEEDHVKAIPYEETDFYQILEKLLPLNPEEDIVESVNELVRAKSYMIILRNEESIQAIGFKTLPENWRMKKAKGFIPLMYKDNRFEDLEANQVFSISGSIDFIYFSDFLFILSKKLFEAGLNFRKGMIAKSEEFYDEAEQSELFVNIGVLKERVGNNQRYLRKIATIKNLGYYKDQVFLNNFKLLSETKNWGVEFNDGHIVITEEKLDALLTVLQNKRLHSELTEEDFDVESAKKFEG
jgi:hypothetical protein